MGKEDGGLARHPMECQNDADWEKAKVITNEKGLRQRKVTSTLHPPFGKE